MKPKAENDQSLEYKYTFFKPKGDQTIEFNVGLTLPGLDLIRTHPEPYPEWTRLNCNQCPNCPLKIEETPDCPVAVSLLELSESFKDAISHEMVEVTIETKARTYYKKIALQRGISALAGIYMVSSGCPVFGKLKPMLRHHLPFADLEETSYRVVSMYLLAQYFRFKEGQTPDWDLKELFALYEDIRVVNRSLCERLRNIKLQDALPNAIIILNSYADDLTFALQQKEIKRIKTLFQDYLGEEKKTQSVIDP
ncbi:MAG: hypothetical protein ACD_73C00721G0004 [uncultured bacterium]|nr:MAG: hypothetical protein ACD_73C00721G0004 [uncultured bacterium]